MFAFKITWGELTLTKPRGATVHLRSPRFLLLQQTNILNLKKAEQRVQPFSMTRPSENLSTRAASRRTHAKRIVSHRTRSFNALLLGNDSAALTHIHRDANLAAKRKLHDPVTASVRTTPLIMIDTNRKKVLSAP